MDRFLMGLSFSAVVAVPCSIWSRPGRYLQVNPRALGLVVLVYKLAVALLVLSRTPLGPEEFALPMLASTALWVARFDHGRSLLDLVRGGQRPWLRSPVS